MTTIEITTMFHDQCQRMLIDVRDGHVEPDDVLSTLLQRIEDDGHGDILMSDEHTEELQRIVHSYPMLSTYVTQDR